MIGSIEWIEKEEYLVNLVADVEMGVLCMSSEMEAIADEDLSPLSIPQTTHFP